MRYNTKVLTIIALSGKKLLKAGIQEICYNETPFLEIIRTQSLRGAFANSPRTGKESPKTEVINRPSRVNESPRKALFLPTRDKEDTLH
jgi:hypothetical protein